MTREKTIQDFNRAQEVENTRQFCEQHPEYISEEALRRLQAKFGASRTEAK